MLYLMSAAELRDATDRPTDMEVGKLSALSSSSSALHFSPVSNLVSCGSKVYPSQHKLSHCSDCYRDPISEYEVSERRKNNYCGTLRQDCSTTILKVAQPRRNGKIERNSSADRE